MNGDASPPSSERLLDQARNRDPDLLPAPITDAQRAVAANIERNVGHFFAPDPGGAVQFALNPDLHPGGRLLADPPFEVVAWEFVGIHWRSFRGVAATGRPVWFRGLTITEDRGTSSETRYLLRQFIDWREVLLQLGIAPEGVRPLVGQEDLDRLAEVRALMS